jgi:uncharacterized spore protein YtfJ
MTRTAPQSDPAQTAPGEGIPMDATEMVDRTRDSLKAGRIFGEAVRQDGVTVIPVARISGGGGSGGGRSLALPVRAGATEDADAPVSGTGSGGGFGLGVSPAGAFVIRDGDVTWRPAVDLNRIVSGTQLVAIVALLVLRRYLVRRTGEHR